MFRFTQQKGNGNTWWVLVAGEEGDEGLGTWRRVAPAPAVHQSSESERGEAPVVGEREGRLAG